MLICSNIKDLGEARASLACARSIYPRARSRPEMLAKSALAGSMAEARSALKPATLVIP